MRGRERVRGIELHGDVPVEAKEQGDVPDVREEAGDETESEGGGEGDATPLAILVSDIHLRHTCPIARGEKETWYEAQERQLDQLDKLSLKHKVPIVCPGDIFHKWNSPPELINFALLKLPRMWAIPGQHDLPHHNYADIKKSAYWTLVQAGRVINLDPKTPTHIGGDLVLHAFPWGFDVQPMKNGKKGAVNLAVVHRYLWKEGHSYPGAPEELRLSQTLPNLKGYQAAAFGDNHKGFISSPSEAGKRATVMNCGGFMRTRSDEKDHRPHVGILMDDGSILCHYLDCKKDKWEEDVVAALSNPNSANLEDLMEMLSDMGETAYDFGEVIKQHLDRHKIPKDVRKIILRSLEGK